MLYSSSTMNWWIAFVEWLTEVQPYSSWDQCQRFSPSQISNMQRAGFEPAENLISDFVEVSCTVLIITMPRRLICSPKYGFNQQNEMSYKQVVELHNLYLVAYLYYLKIISWYKSWDFDSKFKYQVNVKKEKVLSFLNSIIWTWQPNCNTSFLFCCFYLFFFYNLIDSKYQSKYFVKIHEHEHNLAEHEHGLVAGGSFIFCLHVRKL